MQNLNGCRAAESGVVAGRFSCLLYRTHNLGDIIQTLALSRLLPLMSGVFRQQMGSAPSASTLVVNGYLGCDPPPRNSVTCLFAGMSGPYGYRRRYMDWIRKSPWPIGARDPVTAERLASEGLPTEMVGCATLTLPRYEGTRKGVISVDCNGPGERLTHWIPRSMGVVRQWEVATSLLARYRTAQAVYTSRLHVALPCLAFGTPVWLARPGPRGFPERFSLLEEMGVPLERLVVTDVSRHAERYRSFLSERLRRTIEPHDAMMPSLAAPDRIHLAARIRFLAEDTATALRGVRARWQEPQPKSPLQTRDGHA